MIAAGIRGLGLWLPEQVRGNDAWSPQFVEEARARSEARKKADFMRVVASADPIGAIVAKHAAKTEADPFRGITRRHVDDAIAPSDAEARAGAIALEDAGVSPREVDLVFSHSLVPDRITPGNAPLVAHRLGLTRAAAYSVDAVCSSTIAQVVTACAMVATGLARNVLVVQSHMVSRTLDLAHPASPIPGDAAAAMVIGKVRDGAGLVAQVAVADGSLHGAVTWERRDHDRAPWWCGGASLGPGSDDLDAVRRLSSKLVHFGVETMHALADRGAVRLDEIDAVAAIQPTPWYTEALAEALGIEPARVPCTFDRIAHIGAAGVVANVVEARRRGLVKDGALLALYAHGAGVNRMAALFRC